MMLRTSYRTLVSVVVVTLSLFAAHTALALSCARPSMDQSVIDGAVAIFEGTAGPKRSLDFRERVAIKVNPIEGKGGGTENFGIYRFTVTNGWKGVTAGQSVDVLFNNYWGDGFAEGGTYLVVSTQQVGDLFWAPLCGHTIDLKHAADFGDLSMLEQLIGLGHHMKVKMNDRVCQHGYDCSAVQTHCGGCSCGTPVAKSARERYEVQLEALCAVIRITERCDLDCPPPMPSCSEGYCVAN